MYHLVCVKCSQLNRLPMDRLRDGPKCGHCGAALLPQDPIELDPGLWQRMNAKNDLPMVVDFWAPWCGPCKMMAPAFATAARHFHPSCNPALDPEDAVLFAKLNTQYHPGPAQSLGIRGIPTMIAFYHGRELGRRAGAMDATMISSWVEMHARTR